MSSPDAPLPGYSTHSSAWLVNEFDVDALEHLNNVAAMRLFEQARWQMITDRGHGLVAAKALAQAPVIIAVTVHFRREVSLRQEIVIDSYTSRMSSRTQTIVQVMRDADHIVYVIAEYTVGLFDLARRKLIAPTPAWLVACGAPAATD